jgi:hypothetical protein
LANALVTYRFLKFFADEIQELKAELEDYAKYVQKNIFILKHLKFLCIKYFKREFENMAIDLLNIMTRKTRDNADDVFILRYLKEYEIDCLELAVVCDCKRFVSNEIIQNILENLWTGNIYSSIIPVTKLCILFLNIPRICIFKQKTDWELKLKMCQSKYNNDENYMYLFFPENLFET